MAKVVGIDIGTTTVSCAVVDAPGRAGVSLVPDADGARWTAALVVAPEHGAHRDFVCGHAAKRLALTRPELVVKAASEALPVLLARVRQNATTFLGEDVTSAVLTVPPGIEPARTAILEAAAKRAGFLETSFLEAPVAAAIAGGSGEDEVLAIYDLGGLTFVCSIVSVSGGEARLLATAREALGGAAFDDRVAKLIARRFQGEHGVELLHDPKAVARLLDAAECARHELSSWIETEVNLPFVAVSSGGEPLHIAQTLTRAELEALTPDLLQRTAAVSARALAAGRVDLRALGGVILAGGMGRVPSVHDAAAQIFGAPPREALAADEIVAAGAAMHGAVIPSSVSRGPLSVRASYRPSIAPSALSIETGEGALTVLVARGALLPAEATIAITTSIDHQSFVPVHVVAGDRARAADNRTLLRFELAGIAPAPRGVPRLSLRARVGFDGAVEVDLTDEDTGRIRSERAVGAFRDRFQLFDEEEDAEKKALVRDAPAASRAELDASAQALLYLVEEASPGCARVVSDELVAHAAEAALELRCVLMAGRSTEAIRVAYDRLDAIALTIGRSLRARAEAG